MIDWLHRRNIPMLSPLAKGKAELARRS